MRKTRKPSTKTTPREPTLYHNMMHCLSSSQGSSGLTRNNGDVVNIESIGGKGKVVGLFFMSLTPSLRKRGSLRRCILHLARSYNELSKTKKGMFEIVLIAQGGRESVFCSYLKMMPWLAIPFLNSTARNRLYKLAEETFDYDDDDLPMEYDLVLFDGDGNLLRKDANCWLFKTYGADWYPFTSERLEQIRDEDIAINKDKSLQKLLGNSTRDFVIANDRTRIPISCLEEKVVGIYFCDQYGLVSEFTEKLITLYNQLKQQERDFEVVMVYVEQIGWCGEEYFTQEFQYLPWLTLPYMDKNCRRLMKIFDPLDRHNDNCLVIIGRGGSFVNRFGHSVVEYHGIEAYPFSRSSTARMEKRRLEELNLKSLLSSGERDYVISMGEETKGQQIEISNLLGKTIFLCFIAFYSDVDVKLVKDAIGWYHEIKKKDTNFEVVLVASRQHDDFDQMPWLMVPYDDPRLKSLRRACLNDGISLSVFGPDGILRSIEAENHFYEKKGIEPYPFTNNDLLGDVYRSLAERHLWPPVDEEINHRPSKLQKEEASLDDEKEAEELNEDNHTTKESTLYGNMMRCLSPSKKRSWLTRNNGDHVNIKNLSGKDKVVGLFFMSLTPSLEKRGSLRHCILDLASSYNELSKSDNGKFEIVLIAQGDCECVFDSYLKMMPWLAIPFMDSSSRNRLYNLAEIKAPMEYELVLFDCHGQLLRRDAYHFFNTYGADWYPFTDKRLEEIRDEDDAIRANKSLQKLLGNPTRDFVTAYDGTQVSISCLEEKVVGIFVCYSRDGLWSSFSHILDNVYEQLKQKQTEFEVVMVYVELHGWWGEEFVMENFQYMPWLALPHMDSNTRRVLRIFNSVDNKQGDRLIIVGPRGQSVNNFGRSIVEYYGAEAHPFSRLSAAELVKRRLEELSLESLLSSGGLDHVISSSGEEIEISDICGRMTVVLLFIESVTAERSNQLVVDLTEWYDDIKQKGDAEIEVILVPSCFDGGFYKMPWLRLPHDDTRVNSLRSALDITRSPTLSVFGRNGKVLSIESEFHFYEKKGIYPYLFSSNDLLTDVYRVLAGRHGWPLSHDDDKLE